MNANISKRLNYATLNQFGEIRKVRGGTAEDYILVGNYVLSRGKYFRVFRVIRLSFSLGVPVGVLDGECENSKEFRKAGEIFNKTHGAANNKIVNQFLYIIQQLPLAY
jgi:hypothetical protein